MAKNKNPFNLLNPMIKQIFPDLSASASLTRSRCVVTRDKTSIDIEINNRLKTRHESLRFRPCFRLALKVCLKFGVPKVWSAWSWLQYPFFDSPQPHLVISTAGRNPLSKHPFLRRFLSRSSFEMTGLFMRDFQLRTSNSKFRTSNQPARVPSL